MRHLKRLVLAFGLTLASGALAADLKPAIVYDLGGKYDKSFNEAAFRAAESFTARTGVPVRDFEIQNDSQREQALRRFARDGQRPIVAVGFSQASALEKVARDFPQGAFAIIDMVVSQPNVRSFIYREHEGAYLMGMLAAMASSSGKIGFVGGMDIPLIRRFACGYVQGARHTRADIVVLQNMTGTTGAAWADPVKGGELARSQLERGADVIFHAAGGTGLGVMRAAADAGKLAIGTDSNQNGLFPGHVLTSLLKRIDTAFLAAVDGTKGEWQGSVTSLGLAEDGIGWALDEHNRALISETMKSEVAKATAAIISGELKVHDYMSDGQCPIVP